MQRTLLLFAALAAIAGQLSASETTAPGDPTLVRCLISVKDEVQVPAQEPGLLLSLKVYEGMQVSQGQRLGTIDDSQRQMERQLALIEQDAAKEQAANDIDIRYAEAATRVAETEYQQAIEANAKVPNTIPASEVRRLKLAWHRAALQIEQSKFENRMARFTIKSRAAEMSAAEKNIRRRQLIAPLDGEVVEVLRHAGEWVNPGDPVLKIIRFDTLRIEGFLHAAEYDPSEIANRPVQVEVKLARGRTVKVPGKIVYVSSVVQAGGEYRVWAEVANRQENKVWLLRPGLTASMTIDIAPRVAASAR